MYHYRVRFYWNDINAALRHIRENSTSSFHATLKGNNPAIECESGIDAAMLIEAFPRAELDYV